MVANTHGVGGGGRGNLLTAKYVTGEYTCEGLRSTWSCYFQQRKRAKRLCCAGDFPTAETMTWKNGISWHCTVKTGNGTLRRKTEMRDDQLAWNIIPWTKALTRDKNKLFCCLHNWREKKRRKKEKNVQMTSAQLTIGAITICAIEMHRVASTNEIAHRARAPSSLYDCVW